MTTSHKRGQTLTEFLVIAPLALAMSFFSFYLCAQSTVQTLLTLDAFALALAQLYGNTSECKPSLDWAKFMNIEYFCPRMGRVRVNASFKSPTQTLLFSRDIQLH